MSFESLPRELRDKIYTHALVSLTPIIVWKSPGWEHSSIPSPSPTDPTTCSSWTLGPRSAHSHTNPPGRCNPSLTSHLALSLLSSSHAVGAEAAATFYAQNTFAFPGQHEWFPLAAWLRVIGMRNRGRVERLEVQAYAPAQVWQRFDGERVGHPWGGAGEMVYPRCAALGVRMRVVKYGLVDNISPALKTVFRLLGRRGWWW